MDTIKEMGWTRVEKKDPTAPITEKDLKAVFKLMDMDKNGFICKIVSKTFSNQCTNLQHSMLKIDGLYKITQPVAINIIYLGAADGVQISPQTLRNTKRKFLLPFKKRN
jgi:hypothetical protein